MSGTELSQTIAAVRVASRSRKVLRICDELERRLAMDAESAKGGFDKTAYQRKYMRSYRRKKRRAVKGKKKS